MPLELLRISEAESRTGLARSTLARWLKAGRLTRRSHGKIALSDLEHCMAEQTTGRPCMSGRRAPHAATHDFRTLAEKNMETYCGTNGLRRLGSMIKALTWERASRGQDLDKLRDVLVAALAATKEVEDDHARFVKVYHKEDVSR
jgi:hypothetical protein